MAELTVTNPTNLTAEGPACRGPSAEAFSESGTAGALQRDALGAPVYQRGTLHGEGAGPSEASSTLRSSISVPPCAQRPLRETISGENPTTTA